MSDVSNIGAKTARTTKQLPFDNDYGLNGECLTEKKIDFKVSSFEYKNTDKRVEISNWKYIKMKIPCEIFHTQNLTSNNKYACTNSFNLVLDY